MTIQIMKKANDAEIQRWMYFTTLILIGDRREIYQLVKNITVMLAPLADFFDILVNRILRFIKRKEKENADPILRPNGNLNNLKAEVLELIIAAPISIIKDKLNDYAALNPMPPGQRCTCMRRCW